VNARLVHSKSAWCASMLGLLVLLVYAVPAFAEPAEIPFVDGAPVPPNVRPVIIVSGSDYDMGYQYFHQLIEVHGDWWLRDYVGVPFTQEQIKALKARQWALMQQVPWAIEFIKGAAVGATDAGVAMSYAEVLAYFATLDTYPGLESPGSQDEDLPPHDCSGFAAWGRATKDGSLIVGGNGDHEMYHLEWGFGPDFTVMFYPQDGHNFVCSPLLANEIWHPGMNDKGLAYVHHAGNNTGNAAPDGYGVPRAFVIFNTLRYADDAAQAKEMLSGYNRAGERRKAWGVWADVKGNAFAIEALNPEAVRQPGYTGERDFIYATNNTMHRALESFQEPDPKLGLHYIPHAGYLGATSHYYDPDAVTRNLFMWNALHNYRGKVDLEFAKMMYRFSGKPPAYPSLEEAEAACEPTLGKGWYSPIGQLGNAGVVVCRPDDGDTGVYYVANGGVTRKGYPLCPDYYYYYPEELHTFYKLTLAAKAGDAVWASRNSAHHALYYADQVLRQLTYHDPAYTPLDGKLNEAMRSWFSANWERDLAGRTSGNEAIAHLGKALRAFAKCEAYANHVYEALVPPATSPSDLGLKKWFGGWGDWATRGYPWDSNNPRKVVAETIVPPQ